MKIIDIVEELTPHIPSDVTVDSIAYFPRAGDRYRYRVAISSYVARHHLETFAYGETLGAAISRAIHHHALGEKTDPTYWQGPAVTRKFTGKTGSELLSALGLKK